MLIGRLVAIGMAAFLLVVSSATESLAGGQIYEGSWIAESFGNDKVGIGTEESQYFEVAGIPQGVQCHPNAPLCAISSTPFALTAGNVLTVWNPVGPFCRPLTAGEQPRPAKGGTLTTGGATCAVPPCNKKPPLYRNATFFTPGGSPFNQACEGNQTVSGSPANVYLGPGNPLRGLVQAGAPLTGIGIATTPGNFASPATAFNLPAAPATAGPPGPANHMRRTTVGSFIGEGPYLYSYTYATLRNDAGSFGAGQGFFSKSAAANTVTYQNLQGQDIFATVRVKKGSKPFGGVMKLLGSYGNKVCYFYGGGCGLGYGDWGYENIGATGYKGKVANGTDGTVVAPWTSQFIQTYYNTGTVQLVSPILTQWLSRFGGGEKFETGGIAVMKLRFIPEPGAIASLVAGLSMLWVLHRSRR
jgi:hypothetical protein